MKVCRLFLRALGAISVAMAVVTYATSGPVMSEADLLRAVDGSFSSRDVNQFVNLQGANASREGDSAGYMRSQALLASGIYEAASRGAMVDSIDQLGERAEYFVRRSLSLNPGDPFLWLRLFALKNLRGGGDRRNLRLLAMSYQTGPLEGWVSLKRNKVGLVLFSELDVAEKAIVLEEFQQLVDSDFIESGVDLLTGPGWPIKEKLLATLSAVNPVSRQRFARLVRDDGIRIEIPGEERTEDRPW